MTFPSGKKACKCINRKLEPSSIKINNCKSKNPFRFFTRERKRNLAQNATTFEFSFETSHSGSFPSYQLTLQNSGQTDYYNENYRGSKSPWSNDWTPCFEKLTFIQDVSEIRGRQLPAFYLLTANMYMMLVELKELVCLGVFICLSCICLSTILYYG